LIHDEKCQWRFIAPRSGRTAVEAQRRVVDIAERDAEGLHELLAVWER
jgi:hypothetical protein